MPAVDALVDQFDDLAAQLRQPQRISVARNLQTARALTAGRFDDAERLNDQAKAIGEPAAPTLVIADWFMFRFFLYREQGRLEELAGSAEDISSWYPNDLVWQTVMFLLATNIEVRIRPLATAEELVAQVSEGASTDGNAIAAGVLLATSSEITRNSHLAETLYAALSPYRCFNAVLPNSRHFHCIGPIAHALGSLAGALGQLDVAEEHFEIAIAMNRRMGAAPYLAHSRFSCARILAARNNPGSRARAHRLADQARETADRLGMSDLALNVGALLAHLASY